MSGRRFVRAAAAGVGRSAMYGGGGGQISVRRRWDGRGGCEGGGDEVGIAICRGEVVGVGGECVAAELRCGRNAELERGEGGKVVDKSGFSRYQARAWL